jgi:hypothetical protein
LCNNHNQCIQLYPYSIRMQLTKSMAWDVSSATDAYLIRQEIAFLLQNDLNQVNPARTSTFNCVKLYFSNIFSWCLSPGSFLINVVYAFIFFFLNLHSGGWSLNWVHSARRPFTGILYLPRVIVRMENLVE